VKNDQAYVAGLPKTKISINILYKQLGRSCEYVTKQTGKLRGMPLTRKMEVRSECVMAKSKSKPTKKTSLN
jgi:hypothetical protein